MLKVVAMEGRFKKNDTKRDAKMENSVRTQASKERERNRKVNTRGKKTCFALIVSKQVIKWESVGRSIRI